MAHAKRPPGLWILEAVGAFICVMVVAGQTMALVDYDLVVSWGLQEAAAEVTAMGVALNKGFGLGDTAIYLPLFAVGLAGLWRGRAWGVAALMAALGITAYWPVVVLATLFYAETVPGFTFARHGAYLVMLVPLVLYAQWGLFYLHRHGRRLAAG